MNIVFIGTDDETATLVRTSVLIRWPDAVCWVTSDVAVGLALIGEFSPNLVVLGPPFPESSLPEVILDTRRTTPAPLIVLSGGDGPKEIIEAWKQGPITT